MVEPLEFIEHGGSVVVPRHFHAWGREGIGADARSTVVFGVRDGRIIELRLYPQTAEALRAAGLEE